MPVGFRSSVDRMGWHSKLIIILVFGCQQLLPTLTSLDLSKNKIRWLPSSLLSLNELGVLNLSDNTFTVVPPWLHRLSSLGRLDLESNPLLAPTVAIASSGLAEIRQVGHNYPQWPNHRPLGGISLIG